MGLRDYLRIGQAAQLPVAGDDVPLVAVVNPDGSTISAGGGGSSGGSVTAPGTAGAQAQTIQGNAAGVPVPVSGAVTTSVTQRAMLSEGSSTTSATVNTSATILAADPNRKKLSYQNTGSATIALRINVGADTTAANATPPAAGATTAKRMIFVPAGQYYVTEPDELCTGQINTASLTASVPQTWAAS